MDSDKLKINTYPNRVPHVLFPPAYNAVHNFDIICISETFLNSSYSNGYNLIRSDNINNTKRGGVCIYFKEHLPLTKRDISPLNECLVCEIKVKKSKCFLTCIYRSPNQSSDQFSDFCSGLETTFNNIMLESPTCSFVIGDFNAKWSDGISNLCGLELNDLCSIFGH